MNRWKVTNQRRRMRFVPVKGEEMQGAAAVFRVRELLIRQRTQTINALRGHLTEFGEVVPQGTVSMRRLITVIEEAGSDLLETARATLQVLVDGLRHLEERIAGLDVEIARRAREDDLARRLMTVPGIGPLIATALATLAPPPKMFRKARDFAAWLGLTSRQHSTGGKQRLGATTKMGERSLRRLLILGGRQRGDQAQHQSHGAAGHLARRAACTQAGEAGAGGACEQRAIIRHWFENNGECAHRLGPDGPGRRLQSSGRGGVVRRGRGTSERRRARSGMAQSS